MRSCVLQVRVFPRSCAQLSRVGMDRFAGMKWRQKQRQEGNGRAAVSPNIQVHLSRIKFTSILPKFVCMYACVYIYS